MITHYDLLGSGAKGKNYGTFYEEAVRIFTSLQELENVGDPIAVTQVSLVVCQPSSAVLLPFAISG